MIGPQEVPRGKFYQLTILIFKFNQPSSSAQDGNLGKLGPKVGSFNCNGLGTRLKRDSVINCLSSKPEEIFILQETHSTPKTEKEWIKSWGGRIYFNHGSSNATGVCILIKRSAKHIKVSKHAIVEQGRVHYIEIDIDGVSYCVVNVYAPNNDNLPMFENIFLDILGRPRNDFILLGGDWNTVLNNLLL